MNSNSVRQINITKIKGLVAELTYSHAQSAWGSRGERVRAAGLAACCNYFKKRKKRTVTQLLGVEPRIDKLIGF